MKRLFFIIAFCFITCFSLYGQSSDFNNIVNACEKAQSSMSDGEGSDSEINEAYDLLMKSKFSPLIISATENTKKNEANISEHMVFSPAFLNDIKTNKKVFKKAKQYAEELDALERGNNVQMCTKCIDAHKSVTYSFRTADSKLHIAAVSEVNGLINLYININGKIYKDTSNEYKGASSRIFKDINLGSGLNDVYLTIENKFDKPRSVAIIIE